MSTTAQLPTQPAPSRAPTGSEPPEISWSRLDRIGVGFAWAAGITLCLVAGSIIAYMLYRGLQYTNLNLIFSHPVGGLNQEKSGGFLDPVIGSLILTVLGTLLAFPIGVATAIWLSEYARPSWLARAVESCIEVVAGTPTVVLAIFGLILFSKAFFSFLSFTAQGNAVFGRSFFTAAAMMALLALPLIVGSTREALQSVPSHVREASYALGKGKAATIRRVLLPASRRGMATGTTLGMGRIIGDTAIVVILLGGTLQLQKEGGTPILGVLKGTGSTLTSYVYNNSPAGEGGAPEKAYAAAFVLLIIVVALNFGVDLIARRRESGWTT